MIVYHGGFDIIRKPEIFEPKRTLDFGFGFYATTNFEQAKKWALIKKERFHYHKAIVNFYEFDKSVLKKSELKCKILKKLMKNGWILLYQIVKIYVFLTIMILFLVQLQMITFMQV